MKRILTLTILCSLFAAGLQSCSKCYECDYGNGVVKELCPKDFPDKSEGLKLTIDALEKQGYTCNTK
jgi:hypothetical protein